MLLSGSFLVWANFGMLDQFATAVGEAGGNIAAIGGFDVRGPALEEDLVVNCRDEAHIAAVRAAVEGIEGCEVLELLDRFRGTGVIVRFLEYMDVGHRNHWERDVVVPSRELLARIAARWPLAPLQPPYRAAGAERYAFTDGAGEIGFISSVTQPFCGDCTRARLSSDGVLYTCLFATHGTALRDKLRSGASDDELFETLRGVWRERADNYSEQRQGPIAAENARKVEMFYIGG